MKNKLFALLLLVSALFMTSCKNEEPQGGFIEIKCTNVSKYNRVAITNGSLYVQIFNSVSETMKSKQLPEGIYVVNAYYAASGTGAASQVVVLFDGKSETVTIQ